jgi:hypothetical protein
VKTASYEAGTISVPAGHEGSRIWSGGGDEGRIAATSKVDAMVKGNLLASGLL